MVKIRLRRAGAKKQASFRVVVADSRAPRDGRFIERIGIYNPRTEPETLKIDEGRALHWLSVGAQPTESVMRLLTTNGTMARFERLKEGESLEDLVAEAEAPEVTEEEIPEAEVTEVADIEEESEDLEEAEETDEEPEEAEETDEEPVEAEAPAEEVEEVAEEATEEPVEDVEEVVEDVEEVEET